MLISFAYRLTRKILSAVATIARRDVSSDAELLGRVWRCDQSMGSRVRLVPDW